MKKINFYVVTDSERTESETRYSGQVIAVFGDGESRDELFRTDYEFIDRFEAETNTYNNFIAWLKKTTLHSAQPEIAGMYAEDIVAQASASRSSVGRIGKSENVTVRGRPKKES